MVWPQTYDPVGNAFFSTVLAAVPIVILLGAIAVLRMPAHRAALAGLGSALVLSIGIYGMPLLAATTTAVYGALYGLFPIGWIILNLIFLYLLTVRRGLFEVLRASLAALAPDRRVQVLLIAFSFGAFFEGAAGFGTPVAVSAAILMSLGFKPLTAAGLSLIANTAPVAFGALGTPIIALSAVTGLDLFELSGMVGRQLPFFSVLVPFWVIWAYAGWRGMIAVWPAALTAGVTFAVPQYLVSNFHGPWLVDIISSICSMGALIALLRVWRPRDQWRAEVAQHPTQTETAPYSGRETARAWMPWLLLSVIVFVWGLPQTKAFLDGFFAPKFEVPYLHEQVQRVPPVAPVSAAPEKAVFTLNGLSATGTGILVSALAAGAAMGFSWRELARVYLDSLIRVRYSLLTIAAMLGLGYLTKYAGMDATLGLALAKTGSLYPFFGTLLGWLGVALTGSDTASNVLFGGLQKITAEQTGVSPVLMAAANSSGGVMGKMVDAQSIVVASTATNWYGHESEILRYVFFHSIALAALVGALVYAQAYIYPFTLMAP